MSRTTKPPKRLTRTALGLFFVGFVLYVFSAIRVYVHACDHMPRSIAMGAVALGICGTGLLTTSAVIVRTAASWLTVIGVFLLLLAMYLGVNATVPVGCSVT
jgi:hypothetical protein